MIWVLIGIIISYITAFITCEYASRQGVKQPQKEGYYYGMFTTCLTTFGFLVPITMAILGIALYIMGE